MRMQMCAYPIPVGAVPAPRFKGVTLLGTMLCCYLVFRRGPRNCPGCGLPVISKKAFEKYRAEFNAEMLRSAK